MTSHDCRLRTGDRVVFLGDSITQGGDQPGGYVQRFREEVTLGMPEQPVEVVASGVSGDRLVDCERRLPLVLETCQPTQVVVFAGVNDVWYATRGTGTDLETFRSSCLGLIETARAAGIGLWLCTPGLIGERIDGTNSFDAELDRYAEAVREIATEHRVELIDLRQRLLEHLRQINPENRPHSMLTTDGVHLNGLGNRFVAECCLEAFGIRVAETPDRWLRHLVLFKFRPGTSAEELERVDQAFRQLAQRIDVIADLEGGTDNSPEGLQKGFTQAYVVSFRSEGDRAIYLPHPEHQRFVQQVKPLLDDVLVVDYWADRSVG